MSINAARPFTVTGRLECNFKPEDINHPKHIAGLEVEIWQKSPMDVYFLGKGTTNEDGYYTVEFTVENDSPRMVEGELQDVFLKIYYQGILINGDNPYLNRETISFYLDQEGDLMLETSVCGKPDAYLNDNGDLIIDSCDANSYRLDNNGDLLKNE